MAIFQNNMYWAAKSFENINTIVTEALNMNSSYHKHKIMGIPATYLDPKISLLMQIFYIIHLI